MADAPGFRGRVALGAGGSWTDVVVLGTDERARALCDAIVAAEVAQLARVPGLTAPVVDACTTAALPPAPRHPVGLVTVTPRTEEDEQLASALRGQAPAPPALGPARTATVTRTLPFFDREACERARARIAAEDERAHVETKQAIAKFVAEELGVAIRDQTRACTAHPSGPGRASTRDCDEASVRRALLEERARNPEEPPRPPAGRCEAR